ncbi:glycogen debranching protein [Dactylosporangium roseum]|uniref:Glycogen debranching protein n=1 Tax=Dactylosporangium roseum TaxID=47989 RepID=A0ABY5ZBD7_9ACTN|nr:glycogen debranching protein [Dactylosporangium roseum]UWZ39341.1 glycogen debranching protein [Dactylosporangium roseum]
MFELDLRERPFTDRLSRLLVMRAENGSLWIARAEYETPLSQTTLFTGLRVYRGGEELPIRRARPGGIEFDGGVRLAFANPDTLVLAGQDARAVWDGGGAAIDGHFVLTGHLNDGDVLGGDWQKWFDLLPPTRADLRERAAMAWWTLGINQLTIQNRVGVVPSKYGYVALWNWDSYFHAIALRHVDPALAREQIRILLDSQRPDGMIPDVVHDHGALYETTDLPQSDHARLAQHVGTANGARPEHVAVPVTKPPLTAWAVWKIHTVAPDLEFLREVYPKLVAAQHWWFAASDPDGDGLAEYLHPYSSGLDDSPIWDYGPRAEPPDLNSYLVHQFDVLADIADALGLDGHEHREAAERLTALMIARRWNGNRFVTLAGGSEVPVKTPLRLMPLFTGRLPADIARALVDDLLSASFWGDRPVPTVAFDDAAFDPERMWRGPVWLNINYLLIDGLRRSGFAAEADELRQRTLAMVRDGGGIYEYWNPLTGQRAGRATSGFGWSAALFLDLARGHPDAGCSGSARLTVHGDAPRSRGSADAG